MRWVKYALIAVAPIALGLGVWLTFFRSGVPLPTGITFVDITTGEIVRIPRSEVISIPEQNSAGEYVLYPVEKDPQGEFIITERARPGLEKWANDKRLKVDLRTYRLTKGSK